MTYSAWRIPGIKPNSVSKMLSQKWPLRPTSRKTPSGGRIIAKIILIGSVAVTAITGSFGYQSEVLLA
jgi:hypothetical protein